MQVIKHEGSRPIKAWVGRKITHEGEDVEWHAPDIEDSALVQLENLARLPFIHMNGVAVMPDVHAGIGSTVGTVIATDKAIIPAAVGVDIGCGMNAVRLTLKAHQLPDNLAGIRDAIEKAVPLGKGGNVTDQQPHYGIDGIPTAVAGIFNGSHKAAAKAGSQIGTLGSGNHFIELCVDENDDVWVMLHSGSRGIGNMIGTHFISKAKKNMEKFFINLPDADLAYFPEDTEDFNDYVAAVSWAQDYALTNRKVMMDAVIRAIFKVLGVSQLGKVMVTDEAVACFPGFTDVTAIGVKEAHRRLYDGPIVTIKTESGKSLTVTPNHPILSINGWAAAQSFNVGDSVISAVTCDGLRDGVNPDVEGVPTSFSKVFDTLAAFDSPKRVVGASVNFHGDTGVNDSEVEIVRSNRVLTYGVHSALLKEFGKQGFLCPKLAESQTFCDRALKSFGVSKGSEAGSSYSCASKTFSGGEFTHTDFLGCPPTADSDTSKPEKFSHTRGANTSQSGQALDGVSQRIALDKIVDVVWGHWTGHVYNLSTDSGWYLAEGIITHNCHHNYVERENHFGRNLWVTRKGAVSARKGQLGIIPGSMGQKSYIVRGKGNVESYCSCSHGAGRQMSRTEAKRRFSLTDLIAQTQGVECRKDEAVIDEIPGAYKNLDLVMENQKDLVEVVHTLKAVLCVKGN